MRGLQKLKTFCLSPQSVTVLRFGLQGEKCKTNHKNIVLALQLFPSWQLENSSEIKTGREIQASVGIELCCLI